MSDQIRRTTSADVPAFPLDPSEIARVEVRNGLEQMDAAMLAVEAAVAPGMAPFRLTPEFVCEMNRLAIKGLKPTAGQLRDHGVTIRNSQHTPPAADEVPALVADLAVMEQLLSTLLADQLLDVHTAACSPPPPPNEGGLRSTYAGS